MVNVGAPIGRQRGRMLRFRRNLMRNRNILPRRGGMARPYSIHRTLCDKLESEDVHSNNESGGPNGVSKSAGQSGTKCQRRLAAKLEFELRDTKRTGRSPSFSFFSFSN